MQKFGEVRPMGKLEKVMEQLRAVAEQRKAKVGGSPQTVADDGPVSAEKRAGIERDEVLVREAFRLAGIDYDALIATEGDTPYAAAVKANPKVADEVLAAESPVLAALKVAFGFKPYADFSKKYGSEPAEIRESIRQEVMGEGSPDPMPKEPSSLPFASRSGGRAPAAARAGKGALKDVFGR